MIFRQYFWVALLLVSTSYAYSQNNGKYLKQKAPGTTPEIFAPGIISNEDEYEFGSVFSKNGEEFFYGVDTGNRSEIRYTRREKDSWTTPKIIVAHEVYGFNDPFLSPDESRLYYISDRPLDGKGEGKDYDIWYSVREKEGWSAPINAGPNINTKANEYYMSFTAEGTMYFSSNKNAAQNEGHNFDIYSAAYRNSEFQKPVKLSAAINTKAYEADVFVALDESYVIFCATRKDGFGRGDLYISFKQEDGSWTEAKNMGASINTKNHELCPFVSNDGKYLFYTSNRDIYWVDAKILDSYR